MVKDGNMFVILMASLTLIFKTSLLSRERKFANDKKARKFYSEKKLYRRYIHACPH